MLPYKNFRDGAVSQPIEKLNVSKDTDSNLLHLCAIELLHAIESGNTKAIADALQAAFYACDAQPHEEGPHV
jgi:hypothetical protein